MNELAVGQILEAAEQRAQAGRVDAARTVAGLIHDWCGRPHDICVCQDNPWRGPAVAAAIRERQERQRRAQREAA